MELHALILIYWFVWVCDGGTRANLPNSIDILIDKNVVARFINVQTQSFALVYASKTVKA